ncbi:hypothetical protein [Jiangella endophytica]|uniref:hypothetical protein n=1 Tax=Jiangella endophytica TaxID=1623398 RepID=UPI000E350600|nr:hypothetical protein [Jiangella endophytica]
MTGQDTRVGLRPAAPYGPRWQALGRRLDDAAAELAAGRVAGAEAILAELRHATEGCDDGEGRDLRARALHLLAMAADDRGDLAAALTLADESLAVGGATTRAATLVNRAQTLERLGRSTDALRDLDAAAAAADPTGEPPAVLVFALHNSRGVSLLSLGRAQEAEAALHHALAVAQEREPGLAGHAHANLAALATRLGDDDAAAQQLGLAAELHSLTGDAAAHALARENLARQALRRGDLAAAEGGFTAAQEAYQRLGRILDVAGCQVGRAAVALRRGRPGAAQRWLSAAVTVLSDAGDAAQLTECLLLQGDLTTVVQGFAAGEGVYLAARERCERLSLRHEVARVDVRRAMIVAASTRITPRRKERTRRREAALGLALPAALATDAIRYGFAAGPVRERWAGTVAAPALTLAFELVTKLGWTQLAFELVEHAAASATLTPSAESHRLLDADDAFAEHAWAALTDAATEGPGFVAPDPDRLALPPRLRMLPSGGGVLDGFIDAAEERYGFPVRSAEVVPAW